MHCFHVVLISCFQICFLDLFFQACCHPAVVRGSYLTMAKKDTTMEGLLEKLVNNVKVECEEAHRKLICALNGIAGIEMLREDFKRAAEIYCDAMTSWESHSGLKTDSLQKLHTLHNLKSIKSMIDISDFPGVDWAKVSVESEKIHFNYLAGMKQTIKVCQEALVEVNFTYAATSRVGFP